MEELKRIQAFETKAYGMFIHWGLFSLMEQGEWVQNFKKIAKDKYIGLKEDFDAKDFSPKALAKLAKAAGMQYITLTTRHHEGFSLYDTKGLSGFDVMHSPAQKDLVREFVNACKEEGITPFLYHTTLDWYQDNFENNFDDYLQYLQQSVQILCTEYGSIGGLWFDGNWSKPNADWKLDELYGMIRRLQPDALIINNTGLNARGELTHPEIDSVTFEQGLPEPMDRSKMEKYVSGEMCCTLNSHWGFSANDFNYKSSADVIKTLCKCRKAGANLLMNMGLTGSGNIDLLTACTLEKAGEWIKIFGEAIYEPRPCGVKGSGENFALQGKDGSYYFFVFDLPIEGDPNVVENATLAQPQVFTGVKNAVKEIFWLDDKAPLSFMQNAQTGVFTLCPTPQHYGNSVVVRVAKAVV